MGPCTSGKAAANTAAPVKQSAACPEGYSGCGGVSSNGSQRSWPGMEARIDLSITDEYPLAQAFVIISAVPAGTPA